MSAFREALVRQFKRPDGLIGSLAGFSMLMRPSNRQRNRWTLDLLNLQSADHVFELGCGPGYALALAAQRTRKGFVTGADHSKTMASMARSRLARPMRQARANVLVGGESLLRSFNATLNAVYSANVIQFLDDPQRYFHLAYGALADGGRMATTYQPRGANPSSEQAATMAEKCEREARQAGFHRIEIHTLPLTEAPAICVLARK